MKNTLLIIFIIFFVITIVLFVQLKNVQSKENITKNVNITYEKYIDRNILGTEVATLINKAVDNNEKYKIKKDEKGFYIQDDSYGIEIEIYIAINDTTYQMETIFKNGTGKFVQNFNSILFKIEKIEYHNKTGRIAKILFRQVEE